MLSGLGAVPSLVILRAITSMWRWGLFLRLWGRRWLRWPGEEGVEVIREVCWAATCNLDGSVDDGSGLHVLELCSAWWGIFPPPYSYTWEYLPINVVRHSTKHAWIKILRKKSEQAKRPHPDYFHIACLLNYFTLSHYMTWLADAVKLFIGQMIKLVFCVQHCNFEFQIRRYDLIPI